MRMIFGILALVSVSISLLLWLVTQIYYYHVWQGLNLPLVLGILAHLGLMGAVALVSLALIIRSGKD